MFVSMQNPRPQKLHDARRRVLPPVSEVQQENQNEFDLGMASGDLRGGGDTGMRIAISLISIVISLASIAISFRTIRQNNRNLRRLESWKTKYPN
jgi:hypothetical protein